MTSSTPQSDQRAVRVRGIYATAVTARLLDAGERVVQPSAAIRERVDAPFGDGPADATVRTSNDGIAIGIHGGPEAVPSVVDRLTVGRDAITHSVVPEGAIYRARVADTLGGGAVLDIGDGEAYLPDDAVDDHVETGDVRVVRIDESRPPWADRPVADGSIRVDGRLVSLVSGGTAREARGPDLRTLIDVDAPEGWAIRWGDAADVDRLAAIEATIEALSDRARAIDDTLDAGDESASVDGDESADATPGPLWADRASAWIRLGREGRDALDDDRRSVTSTVPGHHRIKAGGHTAGRAVDFLEATDAVDAIEGPPIAAALVAFGPDEGDRVAIEHGKPDGRAIDLGSGTVVSRDGASIELEREMHSSGTYDGLGTPREAGDIATTTYTEGQWWAPTVYRSSEGEYRGTYVNVSTPVELFPDAVRYVDLHVDVVKRPDGTVERVDEDELAAAADAGDLSDELAERARTVADAVENAL
ncbi:MAG: DUF402 domain-containing protein [Halococcoides sp.]